MPTKISLKPIPPTEVVMWINEIEKSARANRAKKNISLAEGQEDAVEYIREKLRERG
jgi:hypothetical protein